MTGGGVEDIYNNITLISALPVEIYIILTVYLQDREIDRYTDILCNVME